MRGNAKRQEVILTLRRPGDRIRKDHPVRKVKWLVEQELKELEPLLDRMYSDLGRPSIPPEWLLKSCVLMALFSVRSERQFCDRLEYDLMFRFFLDMNMIEDAFDASTFAKNKERLMASEVAVRFFDAVVQRAKMSGLLSSDHFTVDGTLIEAWASLKSFKPKAEGQSKSDQEPPDDPGNPTVNFHGQKRSNATHESSTDPQARLFRKGLGKEAKLSFMGHALMENRNGLCVDIVVGLATGKAEREGALQMLDRQRRTGLLPRTLGADKGYDSFDFIEALRARGVTPHVAQNVSKRRSNLDARTTRHGGYRASQICRKKVEEIFGWLKTIGGLRKTRYRGPERTGLYAHFAAATYNLVRIVNLVEVPAAA